MSVDKFNAEHLPWDLVTDLVEFWQRHHQLVVDGYAGQNTLASIRAQRSPLEKFWPLPALPDGRAPEITSGFYTENPSRSTHKGVDMFYRWLDSDPDVPVGDGGAIKRNGKRRWWYPEGAVAIAAADGVVQQVGRIKTGHRVWINHGNGERTGYFHGLDAKVEVGQRICAGMPVITIGDNPQGYDAKHLHFEVSPVHSYAPMNPRLWLRGAGIIEP
jgi:murein DD-endopeptidase MepM/ murein hydrolase activator NlpD